MYLSGIKSNFSSIAIVILLIACVWNLFEEKYWVDRGIMTFDVSCYYGYLTKAINHKTDELTPDEIRFPDLYPGNKYVLAENGEKVLKTTMGMSVLYMPVYFLGLTAHYINHGNIGYGYEQEYRMAMCFNGTLYLILGLILLRALLRRYFNDLVTAVTIVLVTVATNMFYYTTYEGCMTHVGTFAMYLLFIWLTDKWYRTNASWSYTIALGLVSGLLSLIRPTNALIGLFFIFYDISSIQDLKKRVSLFVAHWDKILTILMLALSVWIPQFMYWKKHTGHYFFYSYPRERFFFDKPKIYLGLLGWRKGWLIYTPIGWLMFAGFFVLRKYVRQMFWSAFVFTAVFIYVIFCWWCWWYGGGYSIRTMVDILGILAFPLAALISFVFYKTNFVLPKVGFGVLLLLLFSLSIFQTYQYKRGNIHYDSMTKQAYEYTFLNLYFAPDSLLKEPPWGDATEGGYSE